MSKRALIVGVGGFRGAYDAGALRTFDGELQNNFFDSIYASSAGVVSATYFATSQTSDLEKLWSEHVTVGRLVSMVFNPLRGRHILDLDYLIDCMANSPYSLDKYRFDDLSIPSITYVLTDHKTGKPVYRTPTSDNIFDLMKAALSVPYLHPPVYVDNKKFVDGGLADPLPIQKAFQDGHDEVWVVYNKPCEFFTSKMFQMCSGLIAFGLPNKCIIKSTNTQNISRSRHSI